MSFLEDLYDGQLLGFYPDNPYSDPARRAEYFAELPSYDECHRIECRLRLDCFADGYDDDEIWSAWHQIANRAAIVEADQDGRDRVLEAWSYWLIEEYEAGKRGAELLEWFWKMLRETAQEIYNPRGE